MANPNYQTNLFDEWHAINFIQKVIVNHVLMCQICKILSSFSIKSSGSKNDENLNTLNIILDLHFFDHSNLLNELKKITNLLCK